MGLVKLVAKIKTISANYLSWMRGTYRGGLNQYQQEGSIPYNY